MPAIRASLLAVLALISCALAFDLARAQDPTTETGTTLHPGVNLIGWTAEPTTTSRLFDEIPQLEAVWAWDAELDDWITAARDAPEWLGGLGRLTPGMGLRMQLSGDQPFHWRRSTEPTRGLVKLRTGWNLVAWSGADETPIDDALKGIGWSLRNVHRWNPATQQWTTWTSPERSAQLIAADNADQETNDDSETPTIRRGEALWINVARAVNWLQPTDILPRLVFPGGASTALQTRVREDLEAVLNFYRTQYGIQANPDFTIYAAKDADTLIDAQRRNGQEIDAARAAFIRAHWAIAGAWVDFSINAKQSAWDRYLLTHEYFHVAQYQMSAADSARWLSEGTANWVDDKHEMLDREQLFADLRDELLSAITDGTPTLRSTEINNDGWEYTLGWLAIDQLTANTAPDFPIEFWRRLTPTETGPHRRWTSTPDWRTVFQGVSGQTLSDFYEVFDAWQRAQASANPASTSSYGGNWIRGRIRDEAGASVVGAGVNAVSVEGETSVGSNSRTETESDGTFAVRVPGNGDYRLLVNINDNCWRYYNDGELINEWNGAQPITVTGTGVRGVNIKLSPNVCGWEIRGRIVGPNAEPLAGIRVRACSTGGDRQCYSSASTTDGSFVVAVAEPGEYHISADLGQGCSVYYRVGAPATNWDSASLITVADAHISDILIQVPASMCAYNISGRFVDSSGAPLSEKWINVFLAGHGSGVWTDPDGRFEIRVPADGAYTFAIQLRDQPSCWHHLAGQALGSPNNPIRVSGADVTGITLRLPDTIEELCK